MNNTLLLLLPFLMKGQMPDMSVLSDLMKGQMNPMMTLLFSMMMKNNTQEKTYPVQGFSSDATALLKTIIEANLTKE